MSNQRIVNFALIATAVLLLYVLASLLDQVWVYLELEDQLWLGVVNYPVIVGMVLTVITTVLLRRNSRVNGFLLESAKEIRQIVWPSKQEVIDSTRVVIVASLFLIAVLGGFDFVWAKVAKAILQ